MLSLSLSLIHFSRLSRSRAHATHIDSSKVFSSSLSLSLFFVHLASRANLRALPLVRHFPTKNESPYLAQKKKFYHSVSTCSSTSFSPSRCMPAVSEHCRRITVFLPSIILNSSILFCILFYQPYVCVYGI